MQAGPQKPVEPGSKPSKAADAAKATLMPGGRFYEAEFPELNEIVVVQVKRIAEMGAYVTLLEYNGKAGMIQFCELTGRRCRTMFTKLLRVGRTEICKVLRVDKDKGYIDLSKKRVEPETAAAKEAEFAKAKAVHSLIWHVAKINHIEVEELCSKVTWPLYKKHKSAFDAFRNHINAQVDLWEDLDFSQPGKDLSALADKLKNDIDTKLRSSGLLHQQVKLRAKVEISCFEYEGIDAIQEALVEGSKASTEACKVQIKLVAHPIFVITCTCYDKEAGMQAIEDARRRIQDSIKSKGGTLRLRSKPQEIGTGQLQYDESDSDSSGSLNSSESEPLVGMGELPAEPEFFLTETQETSEAVTPPTALDCLRKKSADQGGVETASWK